MLKEYYVTLPISGHIITSVFAKSEKEAIKLAIEQADLAELESWDVLAHGVAEGNVSHYPYPDEPVAEESGETIEDEEE